MKIEDFQKNLGLVALSDLSHQDSPNGRQSHTIKKVLTTPALLGVSGSACFSGPT